MYKTSLELSKSIASDSLETISWVDFPIFIDKSISVLIKIISLLNFSLPISMYSKAKFKLPFSE